MEHEDLSTRVAATEGRMTYLEGYLQERQRYVDKELKENREAIAAVHADVQTVQSDVHQIRDNTQPIHEIRLAIQGASRIAKWLAGFVALLSASVAFAEIVGWV